MMMLHTSRAERVMVDDESVNHLMVLQMGPPSVMMLKNFTKLQTNPSK